jgi:hypothetical protein
MKFSDMKAKGAPNFRLRRQERSLQLIVAQ